MTQTTPRRNLRFENLEQVVSDVRNLQKSGYHSVGKWDLAQVCNHIADWMTFPVKGFPKAILPIRAMLWLLKVTIGKGALKKILKTGSMGAGSPTMPETVHPAGQDASLAIQKLEKAVANFQNHSGNYAPSPLFGPMDRDTCTQLQRIHCAHHLSFLIPK